MRNDGKVTKTVLVIDEAQDMDANEFSLVEALMERKGSYIENALIDDVISTYDGGTTCVLTNTNDETLVVLGILKQRGVEAKLIQSIGSLDIYNIAELRYFIKKLQLTDDTAVISNEQWDNAVYELQTAYSDSTCLSK